ncbi:hypothetical protein NJG18_07270, partial [Pseudomonas asiatica]|uniref:hypothetical protein n=1 Tax=Pseudomonas asiatica TaxID=2219225 RepID=UPI00209ABC3E
RRSLALRRGRGSQPLPIGGTGLFAAQGCSYTGRVKRAIFVLCAKAQPKGLGNLPQELHNA